MEELHFSISVRTRDGHIDAKLAGELDMATAPIVQDRLRPYAGRGNRIVYDLEDVSFMDSSSLSLFMSPELGEQVSIRNPSRAARRLLRLLEMESIVQD